MTDNKIITGGVYSTDWDKRPHRVLAYDEIELFYDGWWEHKNDWGLKCHNSKVFFYRTGTKLFKSSSELIRVDPLSEQEHFKYKLNLPFRLCRYDQLTWTQNSFSDIKEFAYYLKEKNISLSESSILDAKQIVLVPLGPKGGHLKSCIVTADNENWFTELELLWNAHNLQAVSKTCINFGVGLFRLGLEKKLASYYIGGYYDLAKLYKE